MAERITGQTDRQTDRQTDLVFLLVKIVIEHQRIFISNLVFQFLDRKEPTDYCVSDLCNEYFLRVSFDLSVEI